MLGLNDSPTPSGNLNVSYAAASSTRGSNAMMATPLHESSISPVAQEQSMWRAVIVQALMDAACGSKKYEAQQARNEALIWLRGTSQDFATVCYYAGYEPEFVRKMVQRALENGCQWRALPGEGKRVRRTRPKGNKTARQRR